MSEIPYICVLDFEATCDDVKNYKHEVIELPSVLLKWDNDLGNYVKIGQFQEFCKPLHISELTTFCKELTGITQQQVDGGGCFPDVLERHYNWLKTLIPELDEHEFDEQCPVVISTCGNWDLLEMMVAEGRRWNLTPRPIYRKFINMKTPFMKVYDLENGFGMANMLKHAKMDLIGRHHSGIDDSNNIARLIQHTVEKGWKWTYDQIREIEPHAYKFSDKQKRKKNYKERQQLLVDRLNKK